MFIVGLLGTAVSAMGTIAAGQAQAKAAQAQAQMSLFKAKEDEQQASESRASAQRQAMEHRRAGMLAESELQARAAASGGGATDPTVLALGEGIAGRAEYGAGMEEFKGENRARGFEDQAELDRMSASASMAQASGARTGSILSAGGSLISGFGSAYSLYKGVTPYGATTKNPYGFG